MPEKEKPEIPANEQQIESKEEHEFERLYRNISDGELFLLWRDKKLPSVVSLENNPDSDAEPNTVQTFWFDKPVRLKPLSRSAIIELDATKIPNNEVKKGEMRFVHIDQSEWDDLTAYWKEKRTPMRISEVYVGEKVKLEDLKVSIDPISKKVFSDYLKDIEKEMEDENWIWTAVFNYEIMDLLTTIIYYEFGEKDLPSNFKYDDFGKADEKWEELYYRGIDVNQDPALRDKYLYIDHRTFIEYIEQFVKFLKWTQTLPEIDEEKFKPIEFIAKHD